VNLGSYELKKHKSWFDEGYSELLDQRKQAKLQCLQDPREINGDNMKNVRLEASRHFGGGGGEMDKLEDKMNEFIMSSKHKNIRDLYKGINEFQARVIA
jgi:hypothetical protein